MNWGRYAIGGCAGGVRTGPPRHPASTPKCSSSQHQCCPTPAPAPAVRSHRAEVVSSAEQMNVLDMRKDYREARIARRPKGYSLIST